MTVLVEMGLFDEALIRGQDVDLAYRIQAGGYRLVYCHEARVFHRNASTLWGLLAKGVLHGRATVIRSWPRRLALASSRRGARS